MRSMLEAAAAAETSGTDAEALGTNYVDRVEAQTLRALRLQPAVASLVPSGDARVCATIHLDDELRRRRAEVENVRPERMLTPEADLVHRRTAQRLPQLYLGQRHLAPPPTSADKGLGWSTHGVSLPPAAPSTMLRVVPLPRFAEEDSRGEKEISP